VKERLVALALACKYHAAANKSSAPANGPGLLAYSKLELRVYFPFLEYVVLRSIDYDADAINAFMAFDFALRNELCSRIASQFKVIILHFYTNITH
jgi:hypothetical protein